MKKSLPSESVSFWHSQVPAVLVVGLSAAFMWHFSNIVRYGSYYIQEPDKLALVSEVVFLSLIFFFGIYLFVRLVVKQVK